MLTKLARAFSLLRQDLTALKGDVQRIEKVRQVVKNGVDGVSPDPEEIVSAVLERIPAPKDGVSPDPEVIAEAAAKLIPAAKPGRDAIPPTILDVAAVVLAKIEKPKDGVSPNPKVIAALAAKLVPKPKDGVSPTAEAVAARLPTPKRGEKGEDGKNGTSVTDVQLNNNELFVFLDGKKKSAGKIKLAAASAPFRPGNDAGGGGGVRGAQKQPPQNVELKTLGVFATSETQTPTGLGDAGKIRVNFGPGGSTVGGEFSIAADGLITCNKDSIQYDFGLSFRIARNGGAGESEIMGRFMYAPDGVEANAVQTGDTFSVKLDDDDTVWRESFELRFSPLAGSLIWFEVARNPGSNNSGQLETVQPAGDLSGWAASNTASIAFGKLVTF
jgi:hypothetical protein